MSQPKCTPEHAPERDGKGRWRKGSSGNTRGRPGQIKALREKLAGGSEEVAAVVLDAARSGDMQACRLILERMIPAVKSVAEPVQFALDDSDLPASARSILRAVASGEIPPDQGKALIDSVVSMARVIEVAELEQQLTELRELLEGRS